MGTTFHARDIGLHATTLKCGALLCCGAPDNAEALCHAMGFVIHTVTTKCGVPRCGYCISRHSSQMWGITMPWDTRQRHVASCQSVVPKYGVPCHARGIMLHTTGPKSGTAVSWGTV